MKPDQVAALAEGILGERLGPFGLERIDVANGENQDGEPALYVTAWYRAGSEVPPGSVLLDSLGALGRTLRDAGEDRVFYLDHRFAHDEGTEEDQDNEDGVARP